MSQVHRISSIAVATIILFSLVCEPLFGQTRRPTRRVEKPGATQATDPVPIIWKQPNRVRELDFVGGPGGRANAPKPPFKFLEENTGGSNPKVDIQDATGRKWAVKWGSEVNSEVFASRIAWAAGYFVEPAYFIASGKIVGVDPSSLNRAKKYIGTDGSFTDARFELRDKSISKKYKDEESWAWNNNPFVGTKELAGLKIVLMLVSNWDSKDVRDAGRGSNTAVYVVGDEAQYLFTDWGGSMGKWGGVFSREKWDAKGFASQSKDFIKGVKNGYVEWGYKGQRTDDVTSNITVADVQWITHFLGRITDDQLRDGLRASGASQEEITIFTRAIRDRITQLQNLR